MTTPSTAATILVVDDHEALCELISVVLVRAGYRVLTATNGGDALQLSRSLPEIHLLVSDIEMPHLRGDEVARRFAAIHPAAGVIFISSEPPPAGTTLPFAFVAKPFTVAELCDTVKRTLRHGPAPAPTSGVT